MYPADVILLSICRHPQTNDLGMSSSYIYVVIILQWIVSGFQQVGLQFKSFVLKQLVKFCTGENWQNLAPYLITLIVRISISRFHAVYFLFGWSLGHRSVGMTGEGLVSHDNWLWSLCYCLHDHSITSSVNTHPCIGKQPKLIFFIPDANLTYYIIALRYPVPIHRIQSASCYRATSVV